MSMALIPDDAHVMLAAAVSTKNVILIADTIMCITDLVNEIQSRFTVAVRPGMGRSMTFGPAKIETPTSYPCSTCDKKCKSLEELNVHAKTHTVDEDVRSATQRLHSLTSNTLASAGSGDSANWSIQSSDEQASPSLDIKPSSAEAPSVEKDKEAGTKGNGSAALKCPICSKMFSKIFQLNIHLSKHQQANSTDRGAPTRTYSCRLCSKEFNHISNRAKHERICKINTTNAVQTPKSANVSPAQVYSCRKCRKPYADNANRLRHERLCQTTNRNRCLAYTTLAPTKPSSGGGSNSLELPISVNNYKQMASSASYMKVLDENGKQTNMFSCIICAKLLQTRTSLESHYMSHLGIKPHACQFCGKRFTDSSNWRKHQRGCTERTTTEGSPASGTLSIAPPLPGSMSQAGYDYTTNMAGPNEYSSLSSPSPSAAGSGADSQQAAVVKMEAVDLTDADNEPTSAAHLTFNDDQGMTRTITAEIVTDAIESQPVSVGSAEMEESEEQRAINTANSVVVDSALSWFVTDRDNDSQSHENIDGL